MVEKDPDSMDGYMFGELADYADDIREAHEVQAQKAGGMR